MAKTKKKRKTQTPITLSENRFIQLLTILLEAREAAKGNRVKWDYGPGERPLKIQAEFLTVARQENIRVRIVPKHDHFVFLFPLEDEEEPIISVIENRQV